MTLYIVSLGFTPDKVFRTLESTEPLDEDIIYIVRNRPRNMSSDEVVSRRKSEAAVSRWCVDRGYRFKFIDVDDTDFYNGVLDLFDYTMYGEDGSIWNVNIAIYAVGGTRSLISILSHYGQLDYRVSKTYVYSENLKGFITIPNVNLLFLMRGSSDIRRAYEILRYFEDKGCRDVKRKDLKNIHKRLLKRGLLESCRGRPAPVKASLKKLRISQLGRIYRRAWEIYLHVTS